ncbi:MAG: hypothetical protein AABZ44_08985, partial [Elusimicrobiota bacterium]
MAKKLASIILSLLILFKSIPLHAAVRSNVYQAGNGEKAIGIAEEFFDGASLNPTADVHTGPKPLDVRKQLQNKTVIAGDAFGQHPDGDPRAINVAPPRIPRAPAPKGVKPLPSNPQPASQPSGEPSNASSGYTSSGYGMSEQKAETSYCDFACEQAKREEELRQQKLKQEQYDKNWREANSVTKTGYYLTILGSLFLGAAGFIFGLSAVATGGMFLGGLFTLAATMKSGPTGFHEFIGALVMSPIALAWGIGSGALDALTFGKIKPSLFNRSNPKGAESLLAAFERSGRIAGQAVALAGSGALALGSTGVIALPIALSPALGLGVAGLAAASSAYRLGDWYFGEKKPRDELQAIDHEHKILRQEHVRLKTDIDVQKTKLEDLKKRVALKFAPKSNVSADAVDPKVIRENEESSVMEGWPTPPKTKEELEEFKEETEVGKLRL